ncbi:decarboxylating NADP(+)-dependent phosphogluconate dehydrogenase [Gaetbulibacter aestuarii]|uniref:6-phosphogluconate dehydrogenase, decarboxylating n=1 Tax=Gaetbulibacter aestuarii TaxID=1502358 RepID=A0ABW7MZX2_9FLAO
MIIIMGVSGCGKTTVGKTLSEKTGIPFFDADDFHPQENIEKMKHNIPLNDRDREPWLKTLADQIAIWEKEGGAILGCSALKESYRKLLSSKEKNIHWVYLNAPFEVIQSRLESRSGHYMKSEMLQSQYDTLEPPDYGLHLSSEASVEAIVGQITSKFFSMNTSEFGIIGLGVMGKSLSLNIAEKGFSLSVFNRSEGDEADVVNDFIKDPETFDSISGFTDLKAFTQSLESPRKILIMIKSGAPVDAVIAQLQPLLDPGDIIIDGGNSYFKDTQSRFDSLEKAGIHFIGCGISGGEQGARNGPSLMPGGSPEAYKQVQVILEAIAAKDKNNGPCCTHVGNNGAGHFVKMIHNGIEYAEMQLLAELYALLRLGMDNEAISALFSEWQKTEHESFLLDITKSILLKKDGAGYLLDHILDKAGNKGTGSWSSETALDLGQPTTMMTSAVFSRYISAFKEKRVALSKRLGPQSEAFQKPDLVSLKNAYYFARLVNHYQGFELIKEASILYHWNINLSELARIWTGGCIIQSELMVNLSKWFETGDDLLKNDVVFEALKSRESVMVTLIQNGLENRVPVDCFYQAYHYWISLTSENLSANLIQAQRDYFGAHTYQRNDVQNSKHYHTNWQDS